MLSVRRAGATALGRDAAHRLLDRGRDLEPASLVAGGLARGGANHVSYLTDPASQNKLNVVVRQLVGEVLEHPRSRDVEEGHGLGVNDDDADVFTGGRDNSGS